MIGCPEAMIDDRIDWRRREVSASFDRTEWDRFRHLKQVGENKKIDEMYRNHGFIAEEFSFPWEENYTPVTDPPFYKDKINDIPLEVIEAIGKREAAWNRAHGR